MLYLLVNLFSGVGFFFNNNNLSNNSIVLLSDIGEGSGALLCLTGRERCCSTTRGGERRGAWRFPNGSEVMLSGGNIYHERSYSSLSLNRRNNAVGPTGIYTCAIPDAGNIVRTLVIGIYSTIG